MPAGGHVPILPRERPRLSVTAATGSGPSNHETEDGHYFRVWTIGGAVWFIRSDLPAPPFTTAAVQVTAGPDDDEPSVIRDWGGITRCLFWRKTVGDNALETLSKDNGATWEAAVTSIAGGAHPRIRIGRHDGTLIRAARVGMGLQVTIQGPGDASPAGPFTVVDDTATPLVIADDTFDLVQAPEGPMRWLLSVVIQGDTQPSEWWSGDRLKTVTKFA